MQTVLLKILALLAILFCFSNVTVCTAQDNGLPPSKIFDLTCWNLSIPTDTDGNGKSDTITEAKLNQGYQSNDCFYTSADGGMVFKCPIKGFKTSKNTSYTRTELREMLRRGDETIATRDKSGLPNKNNWVFSSAPAETQKLAGAVDGVLEATLAVNHVTTTGDAGEVGRVIIGQIHAKKDEPIRLYYRKLPNNNRGSIYAAHEPSGGKDQYFNLVGSRSNSETAVDGFALNEKFSYRIEAVGNKLHVMISDSNGTIRAQQMIDMTDSKYDRRDDFMYFKAGVYNQNKSGRDDDYVQATFYKLTATHGAKYP